MRQKIETCVKISSAITSKVAEGTKVVQVTSLEFNIKGGDGTGGRKGIDSFFRFSSWKLEDYETAVKARFLDMKELREVLCDRRR